MSVRELGACLTMVLTFVLVASASGGETSMTLSPLPETMQPAPVKNAAAAAGLSDIVVFGDQSYRLAVGRQTMQLFSGMGADKDLKQICFVVTTANKSSQFLPTIGSGDYDSTACRGVLDTDIVGNPARLLIIYDSVSPNYSVTEPIVIAISEGESEPAAIDVEASRKLSLAGVTTVHAAAALLVK